MTREEAIKILKAIRVYECYPKSASEETKEAIDMAIESLSDDKVSRSQYQGLLNAIDKVYVEVVRCKDCIHWQKTNIETIDGEPIYDCPFCGEWADANGFCSFGERREP